MNEKEHSVEISEEAWHEIAEAIAGKAVVDQAKGSISIGEIDIKKKMAAEGPGVDRDHIEWLIHKHTVLNPMHWAYDKARKNGIELAIVLLGADREEAERVRDEKMEGEIRARCDRDPSLHIALQFREDTVFQHRVEGQWVEREQEDASTQEDPSFTLGQN